LCSEAVGSDDTTSLAAALESPSVADVLTSEDGGVVLEEIFA
jgi:hypothetical protein